MNTLDITKMIKKIHQEETMNALMDEVKQDLKKGIPASLQQRMDDLITKASDESSSDNNVLAFKPRQDRNKSIVQTLGTTQLLAAAGSSLGKWFSQPINFGGAGFKLDIRKVIGTENEVDLYLEPNEAESNKMEKTLSAYKGQSIHIMVSNNGKPILDATVYIDETGNAAEGSGFLLADDNLSIMGNLSIDIDAEE